MSVIKNVDDQKTIIANKSVIDHSQLANRNAYGAHSIDAIRKLPEKLTSLKNKDVELENKIDEEIANRVEADNELQSNIDAERDARIEADNQLQQNIDQEAITRAQEDTNIENKARRIDINTIEGTGQLEFINYDGETKYVQGGFLPDDNTIELTEIEGNQKLTLKSVYVDGRTVIGTGARPFNISIENKQIDSSTITSFDINTIQFIEGIHSLNMHIKNGTEVQLQYVGEQETAHIWKIVNINKTLYSSQLGLDVTGTAQVGDTISFIIYTGENELQAIAIGDPTGIITPSDVRELQADSELYGNEISSLSKRIDAVEGIGGYLLPYDFDTITPDLPKDNIVLDPEGNYDVEASTLSGLTQYALDQITTITNPADIWNGTRVTNLENNHTWILNNNYPADFSWTDLGETTIGIATEFTLGTVKSSNDNLKISVNGLTGEMSVNNLNDELNAIKEDANYKVVASETDRTALTPKEGLIVYVRDTDITYIYEDNKWKVSQSIIRLTGTSSTLAINLATDMDADRLYIVSGYLRSNSSTAYINLSTPILIFKTTTTKALAYNVKLSYSSSSVYYGAGYMTDITFDSSTGYMTATTSSANITNINGASSPIISDIYTPTTSGNVGQILQSNGESQAPTWVDLPKSIEALVGTEDNPINFATDMEDDTFYIISGKFVYSSAVIADIRNSKVLAYKMKKGDYFTGNNQGIMLLNGSLYGASITSTQSGMFSFNISNGYVNSNSWVNFGVVSQLNNKDTSNFGGMGRGIYAPMTSGNIGQILQSNGSGQAPTWIDFNQGVTTLVGTEDDPINLYTDMEQGKLYSCSGYVYRGSTQITEISGDNNLLCFVPSHGSTSARIVFFETKLTVFNELANYEGGTQHIDVDNTGSFNTIRYYYSVQFINGDDDVSSFYAPTDSGSQNQILQSNGANQSPTWVDLTQPQMIILDEEVN